MTRPLQLTMGPLYFHWDAERIVDFYGRLADEAPVDRVYLGEVVCGKREPLAHRALQVAAERLRDAGKDVVWSAPAMPASPRERASAHAMAQAGQVELNDMSGLSGRDPSLPFVAGPLLNIYGESAAAELVARGCRRLCPNVELPLSAIAEISRALPDLEIELFAFGRLPLALSGRCYHARLNGLAKDACQFVCRRDPDGLAVDTIEGQPFMAVNGVQTLSHGVQLADIAPDRLRAAGVTALRLSPQTSDMIVVATAFRAFLDGRLGLEALRAAVREAAPPGGLVNGYLSGAAGHVWRADA